MGIVYNSLPDPDDAGAAGGLLGRGRLLPEVARPVGARYPLAVPDLRERNPELDLLLSDFARAIGRRRYPVVETRPDLLRLRVFVWRFLYSPEWPGAGDGSGAS